MSIIEEALQRRAEEHGGEKPKDSQGIKPPVVPPKRPGGKTRRPLFWVMVVLLVVGVGIVAGTASYLYLFGGSLHDLAYMMPASHEEEAVKPEAFNRSGDKTFQEKGPGTSAPKEPPAVVSEAGNETGEAQATPKASSNETAKEPLKSPWRVLQSQANGTTKKQAETEKAPQKVAANTPRGQKSKQAVKSGASAQPGAGSASAPTQGLSEMERRRIKAMKGEKGGREKQRIPPKATTPQKAHETSTLVKRTPAPKTPAEEERKDRTSTNNKGAALSHQAGSMAVYQGKKASEQRLKTPPWRKGEQGIETSANHEGTPTDRTEMGVSAHNEPEHPYYQEAPVEEASAESIPKMEFRQTPNKRNSKEAVKKYLLLAIDSQEKGEDTHAIELYRKVLTRDPDCVEALNNLASIYLKKGMMWRAEPLIDQAFKLAPNKPEVITNKAFAEFKKGHYFLAEGLWNQALAIKPSYVPAMIGLGTLYLAEGCPTDARKILSQAIEIDPNNPKVIYNLALAMDRCGRYEDAISLYKELLKHAKEISPKAVRLVAKRLYEIEKSREGTGIGAMRREKGTW